MKANETKLSHLIEGTNQYLVPHFQRPYTWHRKHWETLWADVCELVQGVGTVGRPREHFMGAIVTTPAHSAPEGVTKYLLIDGQQRLTTLLLLLAALRDRAAQVGESRLSSRIHELYLTNRYQEGGDQYKLLPTLGDGPKHNDRTAFAAIIDGTQPPQAASALYDAYQHYVRALRNHSASQLQQLTNAVVGHVLVVSILLEPEDNPYAIFESLNAKGEPLSQSDLVRNYFFMRIDSSRHDEIYSRKWTPMERCIGRENMEAYVRHFLIRRGTQVKEAEVYYTLKGAVEEQGDDCAEAMLDELVRVASHYERLIHPQREQCLRIKERLVRLQRLRATICYPFLLNVLEERSAGAICDDTVIAILDTIENFIVRRYVCSTMRAELNELFTALYRNAARFTSLLDGVREVLAARNYPSDSEFFAALQIRRLYGGGETRERARLILERLEGHPTHRELALPANLSIEHIMPQTLTDWWRRHLGQDAQETHDVYVHTLGNLTLTAYNAELSNEDFLRKRELLQQSRLWLNTDIALNSRWTRDEIEARARALASRALDVWPSFAPQGVAHRLQKVRGTTPRRLFMLDQAHDVQTWQDVLRITLSQLASLGGDIVGQLEREFPRLVRRSGEALRSPRRLVDGVFYESNHNADTIYRVCAQVAQQVGLAAEEWRVETVPVRADADGDGGTVAASLLDLEE